MARIEYLRALCKAAIRRNDMQQAMFIAGIIVLTPGYSNRVTLNG